MHLIVFMFLIILKILTYIFPWFRSIWWCCTLCVCWDKSLLNLGCDEKEQHLIHDVKILKMSNIYAHNISKDRLTCFHLEPSLVCTTYVPGRFLNLQYDLPYTFTLNVLKHQTQSSWKNTIKFHTVNVWMKTNIYSLCTISPGQMEVLCANKSTLFLIFFSALHATDMKILLLRSCIGGGHLVFYFLHIQEGQCLFDFESGLWRSGAHNYVG